MRRELPYFSVDGELGGNQDWFLDRMMYLGGCAALTACDSCIYFAMHAGKDYMCPCDPDGMSREDYIEFGMRMKPYLRPRHEGVKTLKLYADGFRDYLEAIGEKALLMEEFPGELPAWEAEKVIRSQIDGGFPVPVLLLRHRRPEFEDFVWHWFLVIGYEERADDFYVEAATYGEGNWLSFSDLWDTGFEEKGGLIVYSWRNEPDGNRAEADGRR